MNTLTVPKASSLLKRWRRPRIVEAAPLERSPSGITLEARWQGAVVGHASLEVQGDTAVIRTLHVDPSWREQGIGDRLLRGLLQRARFRQVRNVYVLATTATAGFYALHGFRPADPPEAVPGTERAARLLMRRRLTSGLISIPAAGITAKM